jgi:O-acetyl-ADP-ribose deacetylase (regulator of RNase III)
VNTVGVMGKGLALQFKRAYPAMFRAYARAAQSGELEVGRMQVWETGELQGPRYIINFPTKRHWRQGSRLVDIEQGLADLVRVVRALGIRSVAVPPLGCGNGGLDWVHVEPLINKAFASLADVDVRLFPPGPPIPAAAMANRQAKPAMTPGRASLVMLLARYRSVALEVSLVEVQKLMYVLQMAGEPLHLDFRKGHYGPYADNLRSVLRELEGHYITGFGDGSAPVLESEPITPRPGADDAAEVLLAERPESRARISDVLDLVNGFESMYGLELLSSVHWVVTRQTGAGADDHAVAEAVRDWNPRKGRLFTPEHVSTALAALRERELAPGLSWASASDQRARYGS